jgi:hypothetical protein
VFPYIGCLFCSCCFCCFKKAAEEDLEELRTAMAEERKEQEQTMNDILKRFGVDYQGVGPSADGVPNAGDHAMPSPEDDDPMAALGFGFEAYWKMLSSLSVVFLIMTVLFIPNILFYQETGGMKGLRNYGNDQFTLGNLGFSGYECIQQYTQLTSYQSVSCQTGVLT